MNPAEIQTAVTAALTSAFAGKQVFAWTGKNAKAVEDALAASGVVIVVYKAMFGTTGDQAAGSASVDFHFGVLIAANPEGTEDVDADYITAIRAVLSIQDATQRGRKTFRLDSEQPASAIPPEDGQRGWLIHFTKQTTI